MKMTKLTPMETEHVMDCLQEVLETWTMGSQELNDNIHEAIELLDAAYQSARDEEIPYGTGRTVPYKTH